MPSQSFFASNLFAPIPPTPFQRFTTSPTKFLAKWLYKHQPPITSPSPGNPPIRIVCISDTHNHQPALPAGDILLHAGDLTVSGSVEEVQAQTTWLNSLPHTYKVAIAGNHDVCLSSSSIRKLIDWGDVLYLQNTSTILKVRGRRVKIYGAPQTLKYGNWAFQYLPFEAEATWRNIIPLDTDILLTHGPALGHVDGESLAVGCAELLREVRRVRPRAHVCGHVHRARGVEWADWGRVASVYDMMNMGGGGM
jgi:predicted phosphohydrolase